MNEMRPPGTLDLYLTTTSIFEVHLPLPWQLHR